MRLSNCSLLPDTPHAALPAMFRSNHQTIGLLPAEWASGAPVSSEALRCPQRQLRISRECGAQLPGEFLSIMGRGSFVIGYKAVAGT